MEPAYLVDVKARSGEVDFLDHSLELTRRSRALKLWLTFKTHGMRQIRAATARGIGLAELAESVIRQNERWEIVTQAQLGLVTFALVRASDIEHGTREPRDWLEMATPR